MRLLARVLGLLLAILGLLFLVPAVILLNQRFNIVHVTWAVFDPQVNGAPISTVVVIAVSGLTGLALLILGLFLAA